MFPFYICHKNTAAFTVYGSSLETVGDSFPNANIYDAENLSKRLIRFDV